YSSAYYLNPDRPMEEKGYVRGDFVIDIDESLDRIKNMIPDIFELYDIFRSEFGFQDITINYSGNRGFHIHVRDDWVTRLDRDSRAEILNYITLAEISEEIFGLTRINNRVLGPKFENLKNRMQIRIVRELRNIISDPMIYLGEWSKVDNQTLALAVERARFRVSLDNNVTLDQTKLLRMENSIHGDTGFQAKILNIQSLDSFDPWYDAVLFEDIDIKIRMLEDFRSEKYGYELKRDSAYRVRGDLGVFLILQNRAKLIQPV
ncbi:MAG: hypothetical protein NZ908_00995, partial [Candidatus Micrarchaeota archaeon]|nr:hypothetical protein [Candidatus Micrarchaeota archaeon]